MKNYITWYVHVRTYIRMYNLLHEMQSFIGKELEGGGGGGEEGGPGSIFPQPWL